mmetsp:Transcript_19898/g.37097  ORF Transcript_19898/g.37097 Transcript_19898/m.37097 type:complete len:205 (-) Transcript_19898:580-1194(-)
MRGRMDERACATCMWLTSGGGGGEEWRRMFPQIETRAGTTYRPPRAGPKYKGAHNVARASATAALISFPLLLDPITPTRKPTTDFTYAPPSVRWYRSRSKLLSSILPAISWLEEMSVSNMLTTSGRTMAVLPAAPSLSQMTFTRVSSLSTPLDTTTSTSSNAFMSVGKTIKKPPISIFLSLSKSSPHTPLPPSSCMSLIRSQAS